MSKKVKRLIRKIILAILNSLGIVSATSCSKFMVSVYGMPENYRSVYGTVRGEDSDGDGIGEPIPGIQYSYKNQRLDTEQIPVTDEDGTFYVELYDSEESVTVSFKDIDGEENGSYNDKDVTFNFSEEYVDLHKDVDLKTKE